MNKTQINATVVAHSVNEQGDELISALLVMPRIILAEFNKHRMLSSNTSSSRAVPFAKLVEVVENDPFIPIAFQKQHPGMQGTEYWTGADHEIRVENRKKALARAVVSAKEEHELGVTKQLVNRHLEPHTWCIVLATGNKESWNSFFELRCPQYVMGSGVFNSAIDLSKATGRNWNTEELRNINKGQSEIHMMQLAECIYDAVNENIPKHLKAGEWHIPFEDKIDTILLDSKNLIHKIHIEHSDNEIMKKGYVNNKIKTSVALSARTSYTVVGEEKGIDYEAMIGLHDRLLAQDPPHSSPLEHCARAMSDEEHATYLKGVIELIDIDEPEYNGGIYEPKDSEKGWCNNLKGFIPYRYMIDNNINI
jgi:hypothetical protein